MNFRWNRLLAGVALVPVLATVHAVFAGSPPVVQGLSASSGVMGGGQAITLRGASFTGATALSFGSSTIAAPCPQADGCFTVVDDSTITATTPAHAPGTVDVTVTGGGGSSANSNADLFTFVQPPPAITQLSPAAGPAGGEVTINGSGLYGPGLRAVDVLFGRARSPQVRANPDGTVTAVAPPGSGAVGIRVSTQSTDGMVSAASPPMPFTYAGAPIAPPAPPPPGGSWGATATTAVRGTDDALWVRHGDGGYVGLGGRMIGAPTTVSVSPGGPVLYLVTGTDHHLWVRSDGAAWQRLSSAEEWCSDSPGAAVLAGNLTVICLGGDNSFWATTTTVSGRGLPSVGSWFSWGGRGYWGPAVVNDAGVARVFVVGTDSRIYSRTAAADWTPLGAGAARFRPALASTPDGQVLVLAVHGMDDALWVTTATHGQWGAWTSFGGVLADGAGVAVTGDTVVYEVAGPDDTLWQSRSAIGGRPQGFSPTVGRARNGANAASG